MDRANPSSAEAPPPVPTASSAVPPTDTPSVTQTSGQAGVPGIQTAQPASVPAPDDTKDQQSSDRKPQTEVTTSQQPPPQSTFELPPSRQATITDDAPPQRPQQPVSTAATQEATTTSGVRPRTGSTQGGPTTDLAPQRSNPPTPPITRPALPNIRTTRSAMTTSMEKLGDTDTLSGLGLNELHRDSAVPTNQTLPPLPPVRLVDNGLPRRQRTLDGSALGHMPTTRRSGIDWIVPVEEKRRVTVGERVEPTIQFAIAQRDKFAQRAKTLGLAINGAIGLQVILGSLTTGLSGVGVTGRSTAVTTTVLGAFTTLVASYLAKVRGSSEPEFSRARMKHLDRFIREAQSFVLDHGHVDTNEWDNEIDQLRQEFEGLLTKTKKEKKSETAA